MTFAELILAAVTLQRLAELVMSRRNTRRLLAAGAVEVAPGHYPLIVAVHAAWLASLWLLGDNQPVSVPLLGCYLALQGLRVWILHTLGPRWTTRIIVMPNCPLVSTGPYRWLSHPNYAVVVGEIAVLPLMFNLTRVAVAFTILNGLVLAIRICAENRALAMAHANRTMDAS